MTRLEAETLLQSTKLRIAVAGHPTLFMRPLQAEIYCRVRDNRLMASATLAGHLNKSVQTVSGTLHRMALEGWLDRWQEPQESGGYEWIYAVKKPFKTTEGKA